MPRRATLGAARTACREHEAQAVLQAKVKIERRSVRSGIGALQSQRAPDRACQISSGRGSLPMVHLTRSSIHFG